MVSPIRPPGSSHGRLRILVFLKIPEGSPVRAQRAADGRVGLQLPFGTRAERVEVLGDTERDSTADARWRILDVRGTEWTESGRVLPGASHRTEPGGGRRLALAGSRAGGLFDEPAVRAFAAALAECDATR